LLEQCIEHLRQRGVRCIKLDATPAGKPVYDRLGFKEEWTLTRWECAAPPAFAADSAPGIREYRSVDAIDRIDSAAFGVSRKSLLSALIEQSLCTLGNEAGPGRIDGYGILRSGSSALYLGPMVAASGDIGARLLEALLARAGGRKIYWDIPDSNAPAVEKAMNFGFVRQRTLTRMYLGENATPGEPRQQFAIAGPELG
jgi:hypothetical protein